MGKVDPNFGMWSVASMKGEAPVRSRTVFRQACREQKSPRRSSHRVSLITGEKFRSTLTGKVFGVKSVEDRMIVLESEDKSTQVLTTRDNLLFFYERTGSHMEPEAAR